MKKLVVTLLFILIFISFLFGPRFVVQSVFPKQQFSKEFISTDGLWSLIQDWRIKNNFKPYIKDQNLCNIAKMRVNEQTLLTDDHMGFLRRFGNGEYPSTLSENLSKDYSNEQTLEGWLNSPPHRATLEKPYIYSCIATKGSFAVQIFSNCENGCN